MRTAQFLAAGTQILNPDYNEIENCIPFSSPPVWLPRTGGRCSEPGLSLSGWGGMEDWEYCQAHQPCHLSRLPQCYQALFFFTQKTQMGKPEEELVKGLFTFRNRETSVFRVFVKNSVFSNKLLVSIILLSFCEAQFPSI